MWWYTVTWHVPLFVTKSPPQAWSYLMKYVRGLVVVVWCGYKKAYPSGIMWPIPIFFTQGCSMHCISAIVTSWYWNDFWITGPLWRKSSSHQSFRLQSSPWWFETPWRPCGITALLSDIEITLKNINHFDRHQNHNKTNKAWSVFIILGLYFNSSL